MAERKILTLKRSGNGGGAIRKGASFSPLAGGGHLRSKQIPTRAKKGLTPRTRPAPSLLKARRLLARLQEHHPWLFPTDDAAAPWEVGLHGKIMVRYRVSKRIARQALAFWLADHGEAYRAASIPGAVRIDLDGGVAGMVEN